MMRGVIRGVGLCIFGLFLFGILLGGMAHLGKKSAQSRLERQLEEGIAQSEAGPAVKDLAHGNSRAMSEALFDPPADFGSAEHAAAEARRRALYGAGEAYRHSGDLGPSSIGSAARKSAAPMTSAAPMVDPTPMVDTTPID